MTYNIIEVKPLTNAMGAEVRGVNLKEPLDGPTVEEIKRVLLDRLALAFPDQFIDSEDLKRLLGHFGELATTRWASHPTEEFGDDPKSHYLRAEDAEPYEESTFTNRAHIDKAASKFLVKVIGLCAVEVPEYGGDTVFTNLHAAYDALSDPMKAFCDSLVALYSPLRFEQVDTAVKAGPDAVSELRMREPAVERPLVHIHPETGKKALLVDNVWTWSIANLRPEESTAVLSYLRQYCARAEFQCRFHWTPGAAAIFDNRSLSHFRVQDGYEGTRFLVRASVMSAEETRSVRSA